MLFVGTRDHPVSAGMIDRLDLLFVPTAVSHQVKNNTRPRRCGPPAERSQCSPLPLLNSVVVQHVYMLTPCFGVPTFLRHHALQVR